MMEMEEHAEEYETSLKRVQESLQAYPCLLYTSDAADEL